MLIQGQELTVAWLGDSQAVLVRKGQAVTLMEPHKPDREVEIVPMLIHVRTLHLKRHNNFKSMKKNKQQKAP